MFAGEWVSAVSVVGEFQLFKRTDLMTLIAAFCRPVLKELAAVRIGMAGLTGLERISVAQNREAYIQGPSLGLEGVSEAIRNLAGELRLLRMAG